MLTAADVETGTCGTLVKGQSDAALQKVSIDTRTVQSGDVFFAIIGPKQDGHRFIPDALAKGARGIVAAKGYQFPGEFPEDRVLIYVEETHQALKDLAALMRSRWEGILVAITGSMGKTTTREFMAQVIQSQFRVYQTPGNYNNLFGLPLALFGLEPEHEFGIFEMGMSAPGEIADMCRIAAPEFGVITNVAPVHLAFFNSLEEIAAAKGELAEALPYDGELIYNLDDPLVAGIAARFSRRKISFGCSEKADIRADQIRLVSLNETRFRLSCLGIQREASIPLPGAHFVMNALPAAALAIQHNFTLDQIVESLGNLKQASMRGQILQFEEGFTVIDDSYNSNPRALMGMISMLSHTPSFTRRILIAGEMLELGKNSEDLHSECGAYAAKNGMDVVIGIQGAAQHIVSGAVRTGLPESHARFFQDSASAASFLDEEIRKGDLALVKGSRGVHTEKLIQSLRSKFKLLETMQ